MKSRAKGRAMTGRVDDLHHRAMDLADQAGYALREGSKSRSIKLFHQALEQESSAALLYMKTVGDEPTLSILLRSAATLALDCDDVREAERLACLGLSGTPPEQIADELRDVLERAQWGHHLRLRGITLDPTEFQLSMAGDAVGLGMASSDLVSSRMEATRKIVIRTVERRSSIPFREDGRPSKEITDEFDLLVSVPRAASFAVTFRLGTPQLRFDTAAKNAGIIDEVLSCIEVFQSQSDAALRSKIPDEAYRMNFVGLAGQLRPDGEKVKQVGFSTIRDGLKRDVSLTKRLPDRASDIRIEDISEQSKLITIKGRLLYADSTLKKDKIKIVPNDGNVPRAIFVPKGMMSDIVRPLWDDAVTVTARLNGRSDLTLVEIKGTETTTEKD